MAAPGPDLTSEEWARYLAGDQTNKDRVALLEDVSRDGMHIVQRSRFAARLLQAYPDASDAVKMRVDDQVLQLLNRWIDSRENSSSLTPIQRYSEMQKSKKLFLTPARDSAWLQWTIDHNRFDMKIGSLLRADLVALRNVIFNASRVKGGVEDLRDFGERAEKRYKDFQYKVARYMADPTLKNAEAIEDDPHLQSHLRVTGRGTKTATYVTALWLRTQEIKDGPSQADMGYFEKRRVRCEFPGTINGPYPEQRAGDRPAFGKLKYFHIF